MVLLQTITEEDFGRPTHADQWPTYRLRPSARAVLFDDTSRVALMHVVSDNYYKLPGGGIDEGEDIHTGLKRELLEEVGAKSIDILGEIGQIDVYFEELKMKSEHICFIVKLKGSIIEPQRTDEEIAEGYETVWASDIDAAIALVESGDPKEYGHEFEKLRELTFLKQAKKHI